jgi:hypothetical protein
MVSKKLHSTEFAQRKYSASIRYKSRKKWIFKKWQLTAYMDVVNVYGSKNPSALPVVNLQRDANDNGIVANPSAPQNQQYYLLDVGTSDRSMPLPYFGFIFEF